MYLITSYYVDIATVCHIILDALILLLPLNIKGAQWSKAAE